MIAISPYRFGILAELFVIFLYRIRFYRLVARRMRNYAGEIDLILSRRKLLVFVEVKARQYKFDDVLCSPRQRGRIKQAAKLFLASNSKYKNFDIRFDLSIIIPYKWPEIIENAW